MDQQILPTLMDIVPVDPPQLKLPELKVLKCLCTRPESLTCCSHAQSRWCSTRLQAICISTKHTHCDAIAYVARGPCTIHEVAQCKVKLVVRTIF